MFDSELYLLVKEKFPLPVLDAKFIASSLMIEEYMDKLSEPDINGLYKHTIESYVASKFTIPDLINAKQLYPKHPVFSSHFFLTSWLVPH
jgi:hypothetical protein